MTNMCVTDLFPWAGQGSCPHCCRWRRSFPSCKGKHAWEFCFLFRSLKKRLDCVFITSWKPSVERQRRGTISIRGNICLWRTLEYSEETGITSAVPTKFRRSPFSVLASLCTPASVGDKITNNLVTNRFVPNPSSFASPPFEVDRKKCHVTISRFSLSLTGNEGPMRIQYKCLVAIYVFPEMKLRGLIMSKTEL